MVNIAIVGAGFIGKIHSDAYKQIENASVIAVVDKVEEKGMELAAENNAKYYDDLDLCMENEEIDNVDVCVPTFLHSDMVIKAAEAKKNIFCEKPIALSLDEADEMIKAVKDNKVKAMVGHAIRFWPEYVKAKDIVDTGVLGKPFHGFCERLAVLPDWHQDNWGLNEKYSGGAAIDLHIHDLDYLEWIFGEPKIVKAQGVYNPEILQKGGLVHVATNIEFKSGVSGLAEAGWAFKGAFPFTMVLRILCEKGTIEWIFRAGKNIEERAKGANLTVYREDGSIDEPEVDKTDAYLLECRYFIDCTENGNEIEKATFEDGRAALKLALAAVESSKNRSVVEF